MVVVGQRICSMPEASLSHSIGVTTESITPPSRIAAHSHVRASLVDAEPITVVSRLPGIGLITMAGPRLGNPGWDWASVEPAFERAKKALRVRVPDESELNPFQASFLESTVAAGFPRVDNLDVPDLVNGVAPAPFNIYNGTRWSSALGYLDPVRGNANLTIIGNALVVRVIIDGQQAVAVEAVIDGEQQRIEAGTIVLSGGAYGSPAILLRSGVGDPAQCATSASTSPTNFRVSGGCSQIIQSPACRSSRATRSSMR